jgi:LacI family transcriptional regulator
MTKVTIKAVAEKAGVSTAAVSYALSGKRKISPEVTEKIKTAILELGYKPSITARNLASSKTWTIGLYTSPTRDIREDVFFNSLLAGILDELHLKKYQLHLYADYLNENPIDHPDLSMTQPIDGALIMNPRVNDIYLEHIKRQGIPVVVIGTPSDPEQVFYVDVDIAAGAYTATNYLISKGHNKILFVDGPADYMQSLHHLQGSRMAFGDSGIAWNENDVIHVDLAEDAAYGALEGIGNRIADYTAFLAFHDVFTCGIMRFLKGRGLKVPADVAYVSMGNTLISRINTPGLTSIDMAPYEMGRQAAEMLVDVVEKRRIQPSHTIIPARLVERESV